jgi:hypothetical protein
MERELGLQAARLRARSEPASRWNAAGEFAPRKSGGPRTADVNPPENRRVNRNRSSRPYRAF